MLYNLKKKKQTLVLLTCCGKTKHSGDMQFEENDRAALHHHAVDDFLITTSPVMFHSLLKALGVE